MNSRTKYLSAAITTAVLISTLAFRHGRAQEPSSDTESFAQPPASTRTIQVTEATMLPDGRRVLTTRTVPAAGPNQTAPSPYSATAVVTPNQNSALRASASNAEIRRAVEALRDAEDDDAKAAATVALIKLLNETFDQDMRRREQELAQVEERVKNLRSQLDLRREKRQEIIDLQIKVLENEAAGLGFFSQPARPHPDDHPVNREMVWSCSMHPQVGSSAPGKCPICGMDLIQVPSTVARTAPSNAYPPGLAPVPGEAGAAPPTSATPGGVATPPLLPSTPPGAGNIGRWRAVSQARAQVNLLEQAVKMYHFSTNDYPKSVQELIEKPADAERARRWEGPYLRGDKPPLDPWGNEYRYIAPGIVNPSAFDVWSAGPDGQIGTADDIGNWDPARRR